MARHTKACKWIDLLSAWRYLDSTMGMSVKEYEAQKAIGRFRILYQDDLSAELAEMWGVSSDDFVYYLVEFVDGKQVRVVGSDGGSPEDQTLVRDWAWVAREMNELAKESVK